MSGLVCHLLLLPASHLDISLARRSAFRCLLTDTAHGVCGIGKIGATTLFHESAPICTVQSGAVSKDFIHPPQGSTSLPIRGALLATTAASASCGIRSTKICPNSRRRPVPFTRSAFPVRESSTTHRWRSRNTYHTCDRRQSREWFICDRLEARTWPLSNSKYPTISSSPNWSMSA